jgi:pimeloyl-ACP methyl ester carboxylesterase
MGMSMSSHYITCLDREIHYTEWGSGHAQTVIAWHGLARTGRDMDELAQQLSGRYRVICPDTIGRGFSQWSPAPVDEYQLSFYAQLAQALFDRLQIGQAHWIGTSMGGAIGLVAAATVLRDRIRSLVLNDNAPSLAVSAIERIRAYAGSPPAFATVCELEAFFRQVYKPYGELTDAQWRRLTETSTRRLPDGRVTPHYDPNMVQQFIAHPQDYERWPEYDSLRIPLLCLRGEHSDLVLPQTCEEMLRRGPGALGLARVVEVANCGHAPALNVPEQLNLVADFMHEHD